MVGPKIEGERKKGLRYHAKETLGPNGFQWEFVKQEVSLQPTDMILVRVIVGKIEDGKRLDSILSQIPVRGGTPQWNCVSWVKEALATVEGDGKTLGTCVTEWDKVRDTAMEFCQRKKDEGCFKEKYNPQRVPTYDLMGNKEVTT